MNDIVQAEEAAASTRAEELLVTETSTRDAVAVAHDRATRDFRLMENRDAEAQSIIGATMRNDGAVAEPPAAPQPGLAEARATYDWLHAAYADLRWEIHSIVAEGDWVVAQTTMSGRQVGPSAMFQPDGQVGRVFAAIAASQYPRHTGSAS